MTSSLGFLSSPLGLSCLWLRPCKESPHLLSSASCSFIPTLNRNFFRRREHHRAQQRSNSTRHQHHFLVRSTLDEPDEPDEPNKPHDDQAEEQSSGKKAPVDGNDRSQLKWSEIVFKDIQDELHEIDEYERVEELPPDDPWPKFLRGAAYERWGQPHLALAQYALTKHAAGLRQAPTIWERRAYNSFKMGEVVAANAYFDVASAIHRDAGGNALHFSHWFNDNFGDFLPRQYGPPPTLQHAICKYCAGELKEAVQLLVSQVSITSEDTPHALLWFLAASFRSTPEKVIAISGINLCNAALRGDVDWDERLGRLILLFSNAAQSLEEEREADYAQVLAIVEADHPHVDITTNTYLALYHDAFTGDVEQRDTYLDKVSALTSTASSIDYENFLYHACKNRLTLPPGAKMDNIPELI